MKKQIAISNALWFFAPFCTILIMLLNVDMPFLAGVYSSVILFFGGMTRGTGEVLSVFEAVVCYTSLFQTGLILVNAVRLAATGFQKICWITVTAIAVEILLQTYLWVEMGFRVYYLVSPVLLGALLFWQILLKKKSKA